MRAALLAAVGLLLLSFASAQAQTGPVTGTGTPATTATPVPAPALSVTPVSAPAGTSRQLQGTGFPASSTLPVVLLYPDATEWVGQAHTDAVGAFSIPVLQDGAKTPDGPYRAVVGLPGNGAVSTLFVVGDGKPQLFESPNGPSPTSAFNLIGTGLAPNSGVDVVLTLTGALGQRTFRVVTDANGDFSLYVWPQEIGWSFYSAGYYAASIPSQNLSVRFVVQEHPYSSDVSVADPVVAGEPANARFLQYRASRYVWGVVATSTGDPAGEFLAGPTSNIGNLDAQIPIPSIAPGPALLSTPYEWGETGFTVLEPTAVPTSTPRPTSTPKPKPKPVKKKCKRNRHGKRVCKKKS